MNQELLNKSETPLKDNAIHSLELVNILKQTSNVIKKYVTFCMIKNVLHCLLDLILISVDSDCHFYIIFLIEYGIQKTF
jgi:hypothetical protein